MPSAKESMDKSKVILTLTKLVDPDRHLYVCSDPWDGNCDVCGGYGPSDKHTILTVGESLQHLLPKLSKAEQTAYSNALMTMMPGYSLTKPPGISYIVKFLTGVGDEARGEAFLRAKGLWE